MRRFLPLLAVALPAAVSAQGLGFPTLPDSARAGTGRIADCTLPQLVGRARCGTFRVWENRGKKAGRTVDLAFVVLEASDSSAEVRDPVLLLPGGPGETFTDRAAPVSRDFGTVRRPRDILLVDVRGVGRSQPLDCDVTYPGGLRSRFGTVFPLDHIAACRDTLSKRADLAQYTTASSVDDLEELRVWLGYTQFNLLGGSYGTRVAQTYMRRHPQSVRTVIMNGIAPVAEPLYVEHARLLQRALDRVIADCLNDEPCHTANPGLEQRLAALLDRFRRGPYEAEVQGERVAFTLGDLSYALRGLLYGRAADLPRLIIAAANGELKPLVDYYVQRTAWVGARGGSAGYHFSVLCAEDIAPLTDEWVGRATAGTFMGAHLINGYRAACALWPYARLPREHWTPVRSDIPTLLLSGGRDPVTPPEGGEAVARQLRQAVHVVVPRGGHGVGGPCIRAMIEKLIETGSIAQLDSSCIPK